MTPYYQDDHVTLYHGDAREIPELWTSADVMLTDPPYGRNWKQGDTGTALGKKANGHNGIANDDTTTARDEVLAMWGDKPCIAFGDLMLAPPNGTKLVAIYGKGPDAGLRGAIAGVRRDAEAVYFIGRWPTGLGGRSSIFQTSRNIGGAYGLAATSGHPHAKPHDVLIPLIGLCPDGVIVDPFAGSGSILRAAKDLGRRSIGVEIEEQYCETIAKRCAQEVLF